MSQRPTFADFGFADPDSAQRYSANGPEKFVPGFHAMHRMVIQLLSESAGPEGVILAIGAGGGLELKAFSEARPGWRFVGVDPSASMIEGAQALLGSAQSRVEWVRGYVSDAPPGPFDAATCLLTLHFVPDDGAKLKTLTAIRERLRPGARFVLVDCCIDPAAPGAQRRVDRYAAFALEAGVDRAVVDGAREGVMTLLKGVSPERNEALLREAGLDEVELFYAGLPWRGWIAQAGAG